MQVTTKASVLIISGILLMLFSAAFVASFGLIFATLLDKMLVVSPTGKMFANFDSPDVPIYMDFHLFNVTNPEDIQNYGAKPELVEMGPYRYLEKFQKFEYVWNDSEGTVDFRQNTTYFFDEDQSVGSENDEITTLNAVMVAVANRLSGANMVTLSLGELLFLRFDLQDKLFHNKTVSELLFGGYHDPLIDLIGKISGDPKLAEGKFGFYYKKNMSDDGIFKVNTGAKGMDDYLHIREWNNEPNLTFWSTEYCNMINGTDGTQFPPGVSRDRTIRLFTNDLCRSVAVIYEQDVLLHNVTLYRYTLPEYVLQHDESKCFCKDDFTCRDSMVNVKACKKDIPVVLSTPHFYQGSPEDIASIGGLNPQKEKHQTYLDIEPNTGVVMEAAKRIQLNLPLKKYGKLPAFKHVPEVIFPILWANENVQLPKDNATKLQRVLTVPFYVVYAVCGIILAIGLAMVGFGTCKYRKAKIEMKNGKPLSKKKQNKINEIQFEK